tara:strand:+ start:372 stop:656 length:285 start_codon:yes stop_codon:yes gene_type:complete
MPRIKKNKKDIVEEQEDSSEEVEDSEDHQVVMLAQGEEPSSSALRLQLLGLSKDILEHQSHLSWETHTRFMDVSINTIIEGARELLDFVYEDYE